MSSKDTDGGSATAEENAPASESKRSAGELQKTPAVESASGSGQRHDGSARLGQSRYRWATVGLVGIGLLAAGGAVAFSDAREVLFALAATGLFGGVLAFVLGSDRLVPAAVAEHVYDSTAENEAAIVDALGLSERRIYVPVNEGSNVLLYVPAADEQPAPSDPTVPWSTDGEADLVLEPTGSGLFREVQRKLPNDLEPGIETTVSALTEGAVEILEIAREADATVDTDEGTVTVGVTGGSFGAVDRFDHPVASYLAVGFASTLKQPITLDVHQSDGEEWEITCSWDPDE